MPSNFQYKKNAPLSVLMSTYQNDNPLFLYLALKSIIDQTTQPEELILVIDGPIKPTHEQVIKKIKNEKLSFNLKIIRLERNQGLAGALNAGLSECKSPYTARMDSDDICYPTRFEKQWSFLFKNPKIDILSSWHSEFENDFEQTVFIKKTPFSHHKIIQKLKWRNVISHPTIIFRTHCVQKIGGYSTTIGLLEDYDLYMRLIKSGSRFASIQEPLVKVRISSSQRIRRGGFNYVLKEWKFRFKYYKNKNYSLLEFLFISSAYTIFRLIPQRLKLILYNVVRNSPFSE